MTKSLLREAIRVVCEFKRPSISSPCLREAKRPQIDYPPIRIFWFTGEALTAGVQTRDSDDVPVRIYSPAKTVADCFKFRNKLGLDIAIEALREVRRYRMATVDELIRMAKVCRVDNVMRPYLEAMS